LAGLKVTEDGFIREHTLGGSLSSHRSIQELRDVRKMKTKVAGSDALLPSVFETTNNPGTGMCYYKKREHSSELCCYFSFIKRVLFNLQQQNSFVITIHNYKGLQVP